MLDIYGLFGLTGNESIVMKSVASKGLVTTTCITKVTGISRPNCYDLLNKLIEKGLVTKIVQNKNVYYKANPVDLGKVDAVRKQVIDYNNLVKQAAAEKRVYDVQVYSGSAVFGYLFSMLEGKSVFVFGAEGRMEMDYPAMFSQFIRLGAEKRITFYTIYSERYRKHRSKVNYSNVQARFTKRIEYSNVITFITARQVCLVHWQDPPLLIAIKSKDIANSYKAEFDNLWRGAKE